MAKDIRVSRDCLLCFPILRRTLSNTRWKAESSVRNYLLRSLGSFILDIIDNAELEDLFLSINQRLARFFLAFNFLSFYNQRTSY